MSTNWYTVAAKAGAAEIWLHDEIGSFGVSAKAFLSDLAALGPVRQINLSIHSPGGSVTDGWAIFHALKRHPARVTARVEGLCASMASVVAMAADHVTTHSDSFWLVHDPTSISWGGEAEHRKAADLLTKMRAGIANAYAQKTGLAEAEVLRLMSDETWMDGNEAKAKGFADDVVGAVKAAASARFDLTRFRAAPAALGGGLSDRDRLAALEARRDATLDPEARSRMTREAKQIRERIANASPVPATRAQAEARREEIARTLANFTGTPVERHRLARESNAIRKALDGVALT